MEMIVNKLDDKFNSVTLKNIPEAIPQLMTMIRKLHASTNLNPIIKERTALYYAKTIYEMIPKGF